MPLRVLIAVFCLLSFAAGLVSCGKLKQKEAEDPKPDAIPEIVDDPAAPATAPAAPAPLDPAVPELTINKSAQVSVLGYHQFVKGRPANEMQLSIDRFREQMQALKDARIPVIPMKDFLAWRRGEKDIPDPSAVITMDDGWKSVHTLALPILKEFGYPFTIFLYKKFVNGGGKALTTAEIKEIMASGGEIGSHSVSHPYKAEINGMFRKSTETGEAFLRTEMIDSRQFLEDLFAVKVPTYAYPGGYYSEREREVGTMAGYEAMFTVFPAKATWDTPASAIPRYIIIGTDPTDSIFRRAISTRGTADGELVKQLLGGEGDSEPLVTTSPLPNAQVASRRPVIEVDVSKLNDIDPATVEMKIAGFGKVPAEYNEAAKKISWRVNENLRSNECQVFVTFKRRTEPRPDLVSWRFFVDLIAYYLPEEPAKAARASVISEDVLARPPDDAGSGNADATQPQSPVPAVAPSPSPAPAPAASGAAASAGTKPKSGKAKPKPKPKPKNR